MLGFIHSLLFLCYGTHGRLLLSEAMIPQTLRRRQSVSYVTTKKYLVSIPTSRQYSPVATITRLTNYLPESKHECKSVISSPQQATPQLQLHRLKLLILRKPNMTILTRRPLHKRPRDTLEIDNLPTKPMTPTQKTTPHPRPTNALHPFGQSKPKNQPLNPLQLAILRLDSPESPAHTEWNGVVASVTFVFPFGECLAQVGHCVASAVVDAVFGREGADHGEGEAGGGGGGGDFVVRAEVVGLGVFEEHGRAVGEEAEGVVAVGR